MPKYLECHDVWNFFSSGSGQGEGRGCIIQRRDMKTNVAKACERGTQVCIIVFFQLICRLKFFHN